MNAEIVNRLMSIYKEIDDQISVFQGETNLQCPSGCGKCCSNPEVEVTALEMLPLAWELLRRGEASLWLERVEMGGSDVCVFYQSDRIVPENGRCSVYAWRPSLCRLFGFAAIRNKQGEPELAACVRHKEVTPETVKVAQDAIAQGLSIPIFSDFSMQLANIDPDFGRSPLPINQALRVALEKVGLQWQLTANI
jgi:uncharacterized protein